MRGFFTGVLLALALCGVAPADTEIDEAERQLEVVRGTERVRVLNELAAKTRANSPHTSIAYAERAEELAAEISDRFGRARALNNIGIGHYQLAEYVRAMEFYERSLQVAQELGEAEPIANALNNIGILHFIWGDYDRTLEYYARVLELRKATPENKAGLAMAYNNLGNVSHATGRYEESLEYYSSALPLYEEAGLEALVASTLSNIGLSYIGLERFDEALTRLDHALPIEERLDDKSGMAQTLNILGMVYKAMGRPSESLEHYRRSLALREIISDRRGIAESWHSIGQLHADSGDFAESLKFLNLALERVQELEVKEIERDIHLTLSETYERMHDPRRALESYKRYKQVTDALFDEQTGQRLAELQARYEVETKDREIEVLRKDQEIQRIVRNVILGGTVLLVLLILMLYNRYRLKVRTNLEMNRAAEALRLAQAEREKAARAELAHVSRVSVLGELAAALAHEVNQPLTAILSNAQATRRLIGSGRADAQEIDDALGDIVGGAGRAREIIQRLRTLIRRGEISREVLDLNEVLKEIETFARADARQHGATLVLDLADHLPNVEGDRIQLQQVVLNLVHNGLESLAGSEDGGSEIRVSTALGDGGLAEVSVTDSGPGLDDTTLSRIFEPFFTTKKEGLGMGLPICSSIIEAHGGNLSASRNPDRGLTVRFTLPQARPSQA
jgi:signal transduction histidine kinase